MSTPSSDFPEDLKSEVERYLDELLRPEEVLAFEERVCSNPLAFEALVEAMTLRAMVELAFEGGMDRDPEYCREMLGLVPDYLADSLEPVRKGEFAHHLDSCDHCGDIYESCTPVLSARRAQVQKQRRARLAVTAAGLLLFGVIVSSSWWGGGGAPGNSPATPGAEAEASSNEGAASAEDWPELPVPSEILTEVMAELARKTVSRESPTLFPGVVSARERVLDHDQNAIERLANHAVVDRFLREHGLDPRHPDHVILSVLIHEPRLNSNLRRRAIHPLAELHGAASVAWLRTLAFDERHEGVCLESIVRLRDHRAADLTPEECFALGVSCIRGQAYHLSVQFVRDLVATDAQRAIALGRLIQESEEDDRDLTYYVDPTRELLALKMQWSQHPDLERRIHAFATGNGPPWRRIRAMEALAAAGGDVENPWPDRLREFVDHEHPRVAALAVSALSNWWRPEDVALLQQLAKSEHFSLRRRAQRALKDIDKR